jgi:hypothetical protein
MNVLRRNIDPDGIIHVLCHSETHTFERPTAAGL